MSSDTLEKDHASLKGMFEFSASNYSFPAEVTKHHRFSKLDFDVGEVTKGCSKVETSTRRLARLAQTDSHQHFLELYHDPVMKHNMKTPRHLWTAEHHAHNDALSLIKELYERTEADEDGRNLRVRKLPMSDASKMQDDVYYESTDGVVCKSARAWSFAVAGHACFMNSQSANRCMIAFRGSDDGGDWADNILGSLNYEVHNGSL